MYCMCSQGVELPIASYPEGRNAVLDDCLANLFFEKMLYRQEDKAGDKEPVEKSHGKEEPSKNVSRWPPDLTATRDASARSEATPKSRTTGGERESVILRLEEYRSLLNGRATKVKKRGEREK